MLSSYLDLKLDLAHFILKGYLRARNKALRFHKRWFCGLLYKNIFCPLQIPCFLTKAKKSFSFLWRIKHIPGYALDCTRFKLLDFSICICVL